MPLAAQQASGKITGVVTDASGAVIPGVAVTATNTQTGDTRRAESNASGVYVVSPLPVGDYKIEARKEGFKSLRARGFALTSTARLRSIWNWESATSTSASASPPRLPRSRPRMRLSAIRVTKCS